MIDTWGPFYAAYTVTAVLYAGYLFTLWRRARRLQERLHSTPSSRRQTT